MHLNERIFDGVEMWGPVLSASVAGSLRFVV